MKAVFFLFVNVVLLAGSVFCQKGNKKISGSGFCGYKYKDTVLLKKQFEQQLAFLQINDGDTIADIGSSSGAFTGAINVIGGFKNVHFILVDIDSTCLNNDRVNNMIAYYEALKGKPFASNISFVINTPDSLYLPLNSKRKLWIFNTLHEIPDKTNIIKQMAAVLQSGSELIVAELMATEKRKIHTGCHKPLLSEAEIKLLVGAEGFEFKDLIVNPIPVKKIINPYCLFRFIKK